MKKYALFIGETYYPKGGWSDFHSFHDSMKSCNDEIQRTVEESCEWWQILDCSIWQVIKEGS